eukprot:c22176_g1_i1 orf=61-2016(+)
MDMRGRSRLTRDSRLGSTDEDGEQESPSPSKGDITQAHPSSLYGRDSYMPSEQRSYSYIADEGASSSKSMPNWLYMSRDMWAWPSTLAQLGSAPMPEGASASGMRFSTANIHDSSPFSSSQEGASASGMRIPATLNRDVRDDAPERCLAMLYSPRKSAVENPPRQLPTLPSSAEMAGLGNRLENVKERMSRDSLPMLVQHEIRLEDGSIGTYFSLPRDSAMSDVSQHRADNGKFKPAHDYLSQQTEERRSLLADNNLQEQCHEDVLQARVRGHSEVGEDYLRAFHTFKPDSQKRGSLHLKNDLHKRRLTGSQRDARFKRRWQRELEGLVSTIKDANRACGEHSGSSINSHACSREGSRFHVPYDHLSRHHNDSNVMVDKTILQLDSIRENKRIEEFNEHVYRAFLHYAKVLNEYPEERTKLEKEGNKGTLSCLTCKRFSKPYSDTHSLVMHTFMSRKRGLRAQHLGLRIAICTLMGWSTTLEPSIGKRYQHISSEEAKANKEDLILWPPALVIHNALARECSDSQARVAAELAVKDLFKVAGLLYSGIEVVVGNIGSLLVEYSASSSSCLLEAERLHQHLVAQGRGRDGWSQESIAVHKESMPKDRHSIMEKRVLYGYLACAHDLNFVDRDFRRCCLVRSKRKVAVNSFAQ